MSKTQMSWTDRNGFEILAGPVDREDEDEKKFAVSYGTPIDWDVFFSMGRRGGLPESQYCERGIFLKAGGRLRGG